MWGAEIRIVNRPFMPQEKLQRGRALWGAEIGDFREQVALALPLQRGRALWGAEIDSAIINERRES